MKPPDVSLICPAYYDEANIGPLVRRSLDALRPICGRLEVVIVEDGSPDDTGRVVDELAGEYSEVVVLHHAKNRGHGAALKTGLKKSTMPYIAFMDGDGQYEPADLVDMISRLDGADFVQGRRVSYPNGSLRLLLSRIYNAVVRTIFGVPFRDLGCSIKVFKRSVIEKVWPESDGIFAQGELVLKARRAGFMVVEADVECYARKSGVSSSMAPKNVARMIRDILKLKAEFKNNYSQSR